MTSDLSASAQKLARNPLGIIALFLLLVYGIAGLVFSVAAKGLSASERQPLVWFLVVFPVLVLGMFGWLVGRHHTKLYAPSDYRDSEGFFRAMTIGEQRARLEGEVESLQVAEAQVDLVPTANESEKIANRDGSLPNENKNIEATSAAKLKEASDATVKIVEQARNDLRTALVLAEELAWRKLEAEFHLPVRRNVRLDGMQLDGVIQTPILPTAVEIKYIRSSGSIIRVSDQLLGRVIGIANHTRGRLQLLVVLVVDDLNEGWERREVAIGERLTQQGVSYRIYDFNALKEEFGVIPD